MVRPEAMDDKTLSPAAVLTAAFESDPWVRFLEPDARRRMRWLPWFMDASVRLGELRGVVDQEPGAVGLWFAPGVHPFSTWNVLRTGLAVLPARLGRAAHRRFPADAMRVVGRSMRHGVTGSRPSLDP